MAEQHSKPEPHIRAVLDAVVKQGAALYAAGRDGTRLVIDPDDVTEPLSVLMKVERQRGAADTVDRVHDLLTRMANAVETENADASAALHEASSWVARMKDVTTPPEPTR